VPVTSEFWQLPASELDDGGKESWERLTEDQDIRWVGAHKITVGEQPYWDVVVAVAEFLREDPLESELLQQEMGTALRAVDSAEMVWEEDREVWGLTSPVSGEALVRAASTRTPPDRCSLR
jgi:hypothetical protein